MAKATVTEPGVVLPADTGPFKFYRSVVITVYGDNPAVVKWGEVEFELQGGDTVGLSGQLIRTAIYVDNVSGESPFTKVTVGAW